MPSADFDAFFHAATGNPPYDYQRRLAGDNPGRACESLLIDIPTGLGKTAAVVLAWIWNRVAHPDATHRDNWPRRLVFCLPMRTLVEQTEENVRRWLTSLGFLWDGRGDHAGKVGLHLLMGGEDAGQWDVYPEESAILIGTQDMLFSRALNRGYGMSRYRWPMHFALLNNDALWVCDETQLMGVAVETSAQLASFRATIGTGQPSHTWWMSATLAADRLATVDHCDVAAKLPRLELTETERIAPEVKRRIAASKTLSPASVTLSSATQKEYAKKLAAFVLEQHQAGSLTLVIVNRVARAQELFTALARHEKSPGPERLALVHSRFRPVDRSEEQSRALALRDGIVVATQAIEAGVDLSAARLFTELAPWSSLVQRFGRCNRQGEHDRAHVFWIDVEPKDDADAAPYSVAELASARTALADLSDAGPASVRAKHIAEPSVVRPVLRRRDLVDLFDTTPDVTGADLDVSRYIREGDDQDIQVAWRDWPGEKPSYDEPPPARDELCRVKAAAFGEFLKRKNAPLAFSWDPLDREWQPWERARRVLPGRVFLLSTKAGGYSRELGWTGNPAQQPRASVPRLAHPAVADAHDADTETAASHWQTIAEHTSDVTQAADRLAQTLSHEFAPALHTAALWHDVGKAHEVFQSALRTLNPPARGDGEELWAKSDRQASAPYARRGFRHELASALAWLQASPPETQARDLIAYLIAAHHGKVRLSLRPLPEERPTADRGWCVRGVAEGDKFGPVVLNGATIPPILLTQDYMTMGYDDSRGPSWLSRMLTLRDSFGPFRLAWLETLLRAADVRASAHL